MKGKTKRAEGGVVEKEPTPRPYNDVGGNVIKEALERKKGGRVAKDMGKVEGKMSKMRLDRPGRKMGGRVGAEKSPLSSAGQTEGPDNTKQCDV